MFLSTERYKFCVLSYDATTSSLITEAAGDLRDRSGKPTDAGQMSFHDPLLRCIGLHLYQGLIKVIPIAHPSNINNWSIPVSTSGRGKAPLRGPNIGDLGEAFNCR